MDSKTVQPLSKSMGANIRQCEGAVANFDIPPPLRANPTFPNPSTPLTVVRCQKPILEVPLHENAARPIPRSPYHIPTSREPTPPHIFIPIRSPDTIIDLRTLECQQSGKEESSKDENELMKVKSDMVDHHKEMMENPMILSMRDGKERKRKKKKKRFWDEFRMTNVPELVHLSALPLASISPADSPVTHIDIDLAVKKQLSTFSPHSQLAPSPNKESCNQSLIFSQSVTPDSERIISTPSPSVSPSLSRRTHLLTKDQEHLSLAVKCTESEKIHYSSLLAKSLLRWDEKDVVLFLKEIGMSKYHKVKRILSSHISFLIFEKVFKKSHVCGRFLAVMEDEDMEDIGVLSAAHRSSILHYRDVYLNASEEIEAKCEIVNKVEEWMEENREFEEEERKRK